MATISYPTATLIDNYLGLASASNVGTDLGSTRNEPGFTIRDISTMPRVNSVYGTPAPGSIIGVDYPCLITPDAKDIEDGCSKGTIIIIGQDPRRGKSDRWYKKPQQHFSAPKADAFTFPNDVLFGLPWAVNVAGYPHVQAISHYLVDLLLKDGYSIYFSDIFKLYNSELGRDNYSKCMKNQAEATDAFNLLHDEFKTINPCKVLLFGQKTFSQFQKFQETVSITYAINDGNWVKHPAAHNWDKGKADDVSKAHYYHIII